MRRLRPSSRFIDFEASGYHAVFMDAAYLRMPFPAISAMARALLAATADWHADELPLYPALR